MNSFIHRFFKRFQIHEPLHVKLLTPKLIALNVVMGLLQCRRSISRLGLRKKPDHGDVETRENNDNNCKTTQKMGIAYSWNFKLSQGK